MSKPWLEVGVIDGPPGADAAAVPAAKIGLRVFLAVVGALFALFVSAWSMRMQTTDWWPLPVPGLLWFNTAALIAGSVALQWVKSVLHRGGMDRVGDMGRVGDMDRVRAGLLAAGGLTMAFLGGQLLVWQDLTADGYVLAGNPGSSFFYLITGLHGLHMLGGLAALGRTIDRARRPGDPGLRLSVELRSTYWHFLLFVWMVLFALLTGWADAFLALCRSLT